MRYAMVDGNGGVVNVCELDPEELEREGGWRPPAGVTLVIANADAEPGGSYEDGTFTRAPVRPEPEVVVPLAQRVVETLIASETMSNADKVALSALLPAP